MPTYRWINKKRCGIYTQCARSVLGVHWKDWCWSWNCSTLPTWCEELTHLKRPWCWERLSAGGERDDRGWDGWMASLTQWTWVWVDSGSWWWTGRPGMLQFMGLQRVIHDWATELNWLIDIWVTFIESFTNRMKIDPKRVFVFSFLFVCFVVFSGLNDICLWKQFVNCILSSWY